MKVIFPVTLAIIVAPSYAHWGGGGRGGFFKGQGHHGGRSNFIQHIEAECDAFICDDIDTDSLDCNITKPERPSLDFANMSEEEKQDVRIQKKEVMKERHQQLLSCACCTDLTIEDLLPERDDDSSSRDFGFGGRGGFRSTSSEDGPRKFGRGKVEDKIIYWIGENCPEAECFGESNQCSPSSTMTTASRQERKSNAINCICCQDHSDGSEVGNDEVEVSLLLASLLSEESGIQTEQSYLVNPGCITTLSSALGLASVGFLIALL